MGMKLVLKRTGEVLANKVELADSFWSRFRGLMFRRTFDSGEAILFEIPESRKFGIHTFFVFFPIDLVYLSKDLEVVENKERLSSWRFYSPEEASRYLVELPGGSISDFGILIGDKLELQNGPDCGFDCKE